MPQNSTVMGVLGFSEPFSARPKFHANDTTLDELNVVPEAMAIEDARHRAAPPSLDVEGFALFPHQSRVRDFRNREDVKSIYADEVRDLLLRLTGADRVDIMGEGILRFGERSQDSGALDNSRPARFVHIDMSDAAATAFNDDLLATHDRKARRIARYNVWRVLTPPPQDVPLAVCDARSLAPEDLIAADAMFDRDGKIVMTFEALLIRRNPNQRWAYFSDMHPGEALVFKTHDSDPRQPRHVPHGAFDNPRCPPDTPPRASIEMRGVAYWYE